MKSIGYYDDADTRKAAITFNRYNQLISSYNHYMDIYKSLFKRKVSKTDLKKRYMKSENRAKRLYEKECEVYERARCKLDGLTKSVELSRLAEYMYKSNEKKRQSMYDDLCKCYENITPKESKPFLVSGNTKTSGVRFCANTNSIIYSGDISTLNAKLKSKYEHEQKKIMNEMYQTCMFCII